MKAPSDRRYQNILDKLGDTGQPEHHVNPFVERAVLAAHMRHPDPDSIIKLGITPDLFADETRRAAVAAINQYVLDGTIPDVALLSTALDHACLIEIDTSLREHVSAANLTAWVGILRKLRHERRVSAERDRLAKAVADGLPEHELAAILESIRAVAQGEATTSRFVDVSELVARPPAENWLIKGYVALDSLTVAFGDPGKGKSFVAIDIACHVATGRDWRGCPVKQGKVLYVAGEGRNGLSKRFRAWFERYGETPRNIQISTTPIAMTDRASIAVLVAEIRAMPDPPVLVVIDTVNRNFGPGDENSTADMTQAVVGLDAIRNAAGSAMLGLHHSGHGDKSRGRGSSVLLGSVDCEYAVEKFDRTVQVRCTKAKDFDHPPPLAWSLERQPLPWADEDGKPLDSAVLEPDVLPEPPPKPNTAKLGSNQTKALDALRTLYRTHQENLTQSGHDPGTAKVTKGEWYAAMKSAGFTRNRCTDSRTELVRRGLVREEGEFVYLTEGVPDFVPDFVPKLYRTVPEPAKRVVPYRTGVLIEVPGTPVHVAGAERLGAISLHRPVPGNGGDESEALAMLLANQAGLEVGKMLAGRLDDEEWSRLANAATELGARYPDHKARLATMMEAIDRAGAARGAE